MADEGDCTTKTSRASLEDDLRVSRNANLVQNKVAQYPSAHVTTADLSPIQPTFLRQTRIRNRRRTSRLDLYPLSLPLYSHARALRLHTSGDLFSAQTCMRCKPGKWVEIACNRLRTMTKGDGHLYNTQGETVVHLGRKFGKTSTT